MNAEDLMRLNEEIAGMARAGLPLDQGLAAVAREMGPGRLRQVTREIAGDLQAGHTLPEAFQRQGKRVPPYYVGLIAAGVRTGRIAEVLVTLSAYNRMRGQLRTTIVNALIYPAIVLFFASFLFGFLSVVIVPQFQKIFMDFGVTLPTLTLFVLAVSNNLLEYVVLPLLVLVLSVLLVRFLVRRSAAGQRAWAHFVYALPILGTLLRSSRMAAFAELLAILVDHEVPLPEALQLAGDASSDPLLAQSSRELLQDLQQGVPLAEVLRRHRAVPDLIAWMTGLGEARGALGSSLHRIAEVYGRQADMRASLLQNVLPPFMIVATGGVLIGLFVFSMALPLFKLLEALSK